MSDVPLRPPVAATPSLAELRRRYAAAFQPNPWIYWIDLLASVVVGWGAFAAAAISPFGSAWHVAATFLATVALLRASIFIHELAHKKRGTLPGFEVAWNLLVGIPLMLPSLMYVGSHAEHHRRSVFGTNADPEYVPLAHWSRARIVGFVWTVAVLPPAMALRWGVLGPLSYVFPPLRQLAVGRLSTLLINSSYRRPMPTGRQARRWAVQEAATCAFFWLVVWAVWRGSLPWTWLVQWWIVGAGILVTNQVRTLAAHGYANEGEELDSTGQLLDSINLRSTSLLTRLAAPVGMRYHALHHFMPSVPYHSLATLHRRLLAELPSAAPYRHTERKSILRVVAGLLGFGDGGALQDELDVSADRAAG
ncbi:MAG TPA: fatty acid desaturase [Myxococcota bacterium]|jgi:fatty acid desaturase|nr:fatty acid desaturase [Myxococcota bacterium]